MTSGEHEQHGANGSGAADGANGPGPAGEVPGGGVPRAASRSGPRRGNDDDLTGRVLGGRYRVTGRIGRGGMGVVCRADDQVLGREVALKVLRAYTDASAPELADLRTRMQREARAAARIRHSGVVTVHDVIEEGGRPVIVMELVDGPSMDDAVGEHGPLDPWEVGRIGAAVMDALDAAHQVGVLHRDVKPGNVLLEGWGHPAGRSGPGRGRVVLTDFGIASIEAPGDGATTNITRSGELVGSLDYLPPERAQGMDPTPASDIWSLGMTLYAAVEGGSAPFRRTSVYSTLTAIVTEPLPTPRRAGPLTPVLHALMAKNPADRPSAAQARSMLQAVAEGRDPGVTPPAPPSVAQPGLPYAPTATDVTAGAGPVPGPAGAAAPAGWLGGPVPRPPAPYAPQAPARAAHDPSATAAGGMAGATGPHPYPGGPDGDTTRLPARRRRRVLLAVAAVLAVLAAGGGITYGLVGGGSGDRDTAGGRHPAAPASTPTAGRPSVSAGKGGVGGDGKATDPSPSDAASPSGDTSPSGNPKPGVPGGGTGGQTDGGRTGGQGGTDGGGATGGGQGGTAGGAHGGTTGGSGSTAGGGSGGTGGGGPTRGPSCADVGGGKANCDVWRTANSYTASFQQVGHLNMGTNYFYCQAKLGRRETYGKWTNVWWAKTDDDSGNSGVYVSVVYLTGGENDQPVPGLRTC
ncbi:hypothetical protein GCM10010341_16000 [Streptomyces noursei]|nr:hypothetical protein GCM10010341_16000 [Streptomyces noursei]